MIVTLRWWRLSLDLILFIFFVLCSLNYQTSVYLIYQAKGQFSVLMNTQNLITYQSQNELTQKQKENILLVNKIKNYSVDSLGYKPTENFNTIYDQKGATLLWVITACAPYAFKPYEWSFPIVGKVTYKGFFKKDLALKEYNHLVVQGYDVDLRSVSAWSTLGWFNDPLLSTMLNRSKGALCNLLFHELFHATYYAASSVDFNENIASFIAHKATLQFLRSDSSALVDYENNYRDNLVFDRFMLRRIDFLKGYYQEIQEKPNRSLLKLKAIFDINDSIGDLPLVNRPKFTDRGKEILKFKNAYFVDFVQYDSMQDSLEGVFNKIYKGNIEKMVQDLKVN